MAQAGIYNIVVGTAGHIDHGKSSLVRHLTGVDPDRLPEERTRGLTIDLGFAPFHLSGGECVGIVDVPGHERFIKNMVAGASGIDAVALVVAADDSVMPQTREHLDIMTLLGVARGMVVVNKIDLVEADLVELVEEEIEELVAGTFLEGAPVVRVSAETGEGIGGFRSTLEALVHEIPPRNVEGIFRMPIQRVFSAKGHGTVVTGIPVSGRVAAGDRLEIIPLGESGRVRGLQAYKQPVAEARSGHSTAINLGDVDYRAVHRGMVAAAPGFFRASAMIEAKIRVLPHLKLPLRHMLPVRFHAGTVEMVGRMFLLEERTVAPGSETYAQFRLDEPIVVAPGDRFVFRQQSPMVTLGGGEILDRSSWRLKVGKQYVVESLRRKEAALGSRRDFLVSIVEEAPMAVHDPGELARRAGYPIDEVRSLIEELQENGDVFPTGGGRVLARSGIELGRKRVLTALERCFDESPYRVHVPKLELRQATHLDAGFFEPLIARLAEEDVVRSERGGRISLPDRELELSGAERKAYDLLLERFRRDLFSPPGLADLASEAGAREGVLQRMQELLVDQELLCRISSEVVLHEEAVEEAVDRLRGLHEESGPFTAAQARDALGTTRRFAIPLLEYLDRAKLTRRVGDLRELGSAADQLLAESRRSTPPD